jgi:hypothetical protein
MLVAVVGSMGLSWGGRVSGWCGLGEKMAGRVLLTGGSGGSRLRATVNRLTAAPSRGAWAMDC